MLIGILNILAVNQETQEGQKHLGQIDSGKILHPKPRLRLLEPEQPVHLSTSQTDLDTAAVSGRF